MPRCIALDFDGTLISEHVLISWVLFLLRRSGWPVRRRFRFMVKSVVRGAAAVVFSRCPAWAPRAVRTAFGAFAGVEEKTLDALVRFPVSRRRGEKVYILNLNPPVVAILERLDSSCRGLPGVRGYSQGSPGEAIRRFLERADVRDRFTTMGVSVVAVHANRMAVDESRCFTGEIEGDLVTKFSRLHLMPDGVVFIGDDDDERAFRRICGARTVRFVNWRRHG